MEINKDKTLKLINLADCMYALCFVVSVFFAKDISVQIVVGWALIFMYSGLGLRRYCNGKSMMRYGTIGNESDDDEDGILSSYYYHCWTIVIGLIMAIGITLFSVFGN